MNNNNKNKANRRKLSSNNIATSFFDFNFIVSVNNIYIVRIILV